MPRSAKASRNEDELDDGGFIARSGVPLPPSFRLPDPSDRSIHSSLLGSSKPHCNRNQKRSCRAPTNVRQPLDVCRVACTTSQKAGAVSACSASSSETSATSTGSTSLESASDDSNDRHGDDDRPALATTLKLRTAGSSPSAGRTVMLTGTIKRGRQHDEIVEVELEIPEADLDRMNRGGGDATASRSDDAKGRGVCGVGPCRGPHVAFFTILFAPFAFIVSLCTTFYVGTLCWYNVYLYFSEERTVWHRVFICPVLLIAYPVLIVTSTCSVSVVAAVRQVSWSMHRWQREMRDLDKGFFAWLCDLLDIPQCAPYEVVVLNEELPSITIGEPASANNGTAQEEVVIHSTL